MSNNLYRAFEETAVSRIIEKVPQMPDHKFSKKFERKMKKMIRHGYSEHMHYYKITIKRLFICITAALIAAVIMAFSVEAVRDFFKNFLMEVFGTHTSVQIVDNKNFSEIISDIYSINVPENFILTNSFESEIYVSSVYRTQDDDYIFSINM